MYWLNVIASIILALGLSGIIAMMGIFMGASAGANDVPETVGTYIVWGGFSLAGLVLILNIVGQILYARSSEIASSSLPLFLLYSGIPIIILFFIIITVVANEFSA